MDHYRVISRKMLNQAGERTLMSAIIPPYAGHILAIFGLAFKQSYDAAVIGGLFASLPYDFFVKSTGGASFLYNSAKRLPVVDRKHACRIVMHWTERVLTDTKSNGTRLTTDIWQACGLQRCIASKAWSLHAFIWWA